MNEQDPKEEKQPDQSDDELQEAARDVLRRVKIFWALIGIFALCVIAFFAVSAYRGFGTVGIVLVAFIVTISLWLFTKFLELF